jgi:hypothetical protein
MDAHGAAVGVGMLHCAIAKVSVSYWETPHPTEESRALGGHDSPVGAHQPACQARPDRNLAQACHIFDLRIIMRY